MKYLIFLCFLTVTLNVLAQGKMSITEASFSKIKIKEGTRTVTLTNDYDKKWKMRINFPENASKENTLIIALHWAGGGDIYKEFNDCLALPALEFLNTIIVSPEGENQLWSTGNNVEKVLSIVENAKKYWNVNPDKIAVVGYSNGGNGSWYFADKYSQFFSAAIPMASSYPIKKKIDIPLYVIHGEKDDLFEVSRTTKWVKATEEAGTNLTYSVNKELSHFEACAYVDDLKLAGAWLQKIWNKK
mgnify:CR=1 FL=1